MIKNLLVELKSACLITGVLILLTCGLYPLAVWGLAQFIFPGNANGSMIVGNGGPVASALIAQPFAGEEYFHPRPSAVDYNPSGSGGSNLGPLSEKLIDSTRVRAERYREENGLGSDYVIPADAVSASGSGLDPHISVENALLQADRVAKARGVNDNFIREMIKTYTEGRDLWILGQPRVNIVKLNLALDELK
jgi:potassium-transporting ATPase KdpC subunit